MDPQVYAKTREVCDYWLNDKQHLWRTELFFFRDFIRSMNDEIKDGMDEKKARERRSELSGSGAGSPQVEPMDLVNNLDRDSSHAYFRCFRKYSAIDFAVLCLISTST